ncbi:MAG: 3-phosphoshikimate 1-carboxyvinyltransferase [Candidatus Zixiibacteriota bacterium]|nr:MAG: 3-phosphoshikimate 1-carboxyvinyltransferase [candidate division Zixibacteria bacterium]
MRRELHPSKNFGGTITVPGDKSIAHRAALLSVLAESDITILKFPRCDDCHISLKAVEHLGVNVTRSGNELVLSPPESLAVSDDTILNCGNSATTARLLSGIVAGLDVTATLSGDESLSKRPMQRIIDPLSEMGAEFFSENGHLPVRISGGKLFPFDYQLPVPSAQVKSALLLAGLASSSGVTLRETIVTRDHTERMIETLGRGVSVRDVKAVAVPDPVDPRKKKMKMPEPFRREITLSSQAKIVGGIVDVPGDISTATFFMVGAAVSGKNITIVDVGLNPTRTAILDHLRAAGCSVVVSDKRTVSGELRGTVKIEGGELKPRKIHGETTASLIDEIPAIAVMAAFTEGTTVIRDAAELRLKESDRLETITENLKLMGVKCGVLEDGLAIEGGKELAGADFRSYGDHRIAMAFSIASLFLVGPSSIDDASVVRISCPEFYDILKKVTA